LLLDRALQGAESAGAEVSRVYARRLKVPGCRECGGCDKSGKCVVEDEMQKVYPLLEEADVIIMATPVFFYAMPAQLKALIDRAQAPWNRRMLEKSPEQRKRYDHGRGYLIALGATKGKKLFDGVGLTARYFYDALDMSYEGGLFYRGIDAKGAINDRPEALQEAYDLGRDAGAVTA
jgi:multimeric flavodoxin WrbA